MIHALHLLWIPIAFGAGLVIGGIVAVGKRDRETWGNVPLEFQRRLEGEDWKDKVVELYEEK